MTLTDLTASPFYTGPRRVLTATRTAELLASGHTVADLRHAGYWPGMAGADDGDDAGDDGDGGADDGDGDDGDGDDAASEGRSARGGRGGRRQQSGARTQAGSGTAGSDDDDDDDDDGDGDDDHESSEAKLRRELNQERRARRRLERKQAKAEKDKRESEGEYQKLYEDEQKRSAGLEQKLKTGARDRAITAQASSMDVEDIELVTILAQRELAVDDVVDEDGDVDEQAVERALKAIRKRKPKLFKDQGRAQSGEAGRGDRNGDRGADGRRRRGRLTEDDDTFDPRRHMERGYAQSSQN